MNFLDQIDAYLDGDLSAKDRASFEAELDQNAQLAEELQQTKLGREALKLYVENEYRNKIKAWSKDAIAEVRAEQGAKVFQLNSFYRYAASAAAIGLLLIAFIGGINVNNNYSNNGIFAETYIDPTTSLLGGGDKSVGVTAPQSQVAKEAFSNKDYSKTISLLESANQLDESNQYLLAHAYSKAEQYTKAKTSYQKIISDKGAFSKQAEYYLLLTYLKLDELDKPFEDLLAQIVQDSEHPFHKEAVSIKTKTSSFWRNFVFI